MAIVNKLFSVRVIVKTAILTGFMGLSLIASQLSYAQTAPTTPCDPNYMRSLEARAWLEMNREITQNQNLIAKPDSVLEYTCFDKFLSEAATGWGDRMFSETTRWGSITGFNSNSTNVALQNVVGMAFYQYWNANFNHTYLGGRAVGQNYTPSSGAVPENSYSCLEMAKVWSLAKCTDFFEYGNRGSNPNKDGFMDFDWYRSNDPRDLPPTMAACTSPSLYANAINTAFNNGATNRQADRYYITDETDFNGGSYDVDNVITHLDFIMYQGHPLAPNCKTVYTGIKVDRVNIPVYDDGICPNPGCYYDRNQSGTGGKKGKCVPGSSSGSAPASGSGSGSGSGSAGPTPISVP